jgi:acyl transferase domain-containing protein/acyl carrier protein
MSELFDRLTKLSPKRLALLALELQERLDTAERAASERAASDRAASEPIAVIGMGCRLPGADSPDAYWQLLRDGVDAVADVPRSRWDADALYDPDPDAPGKIATRWGGFLDDIDQFEPQFFGISPREAQTIDPQQRLLLEVAWEALERAGIAPDSLHGSPTGVYVGVCNADYGQMLLEGDGQDFDMYVSTGNASSVASGRLSYVLGLQGPALTVDTACSSSLVAVHLAVQGLRDRSCSMALAGGVNVILSPKTTMTLSRAKMMAADGRCKAFDVRADGFVRGEGCGLVVLKRMSDALADGDTVLAVIRGSAINQDGRSNGLTAPNGPSQVAVIRAAIADAGVEPAEISYVEAHGTGTALGDPIEAQALGAALGEGRTSDNRLMIGSVKTNLGHLESAAGVAGLLKVVLSLQHAEIPPLLHLTQPSPLIPWDRLPIDIPTVLTPWSPVSGPRLAGVSAFGFSGTNVHMVLEAAPVILHRDVAVERPRHVLTLSARTDAALVQLADRYARHLAVNQTASLPDVAFTANAGRADHPNRLAIVASDTPDAALALAAYADHVAPPPSTIVRHGVAARVPEVVFLFTGHGSQHVDMGRALYAGQPVFRDAIDRCAELLAPLMPRSLLEVMFSDTPRDLAALDEPALSSEQLMASMTYAQPALFALEYALAELWQSWGVRPSAVAGHSAGEYVAAVVAGAISLADGLKLIAARGRLMASLPPDGEMATVFAGEDRVAAAIAPHRGRVSIAAINGPESVALSGTGGALRVVLDDLRDAGIEVRPLSIPIAAHSPQVDPILDAFEAVAATVQFSTPRVDVISGMTGRMAQGDDLVTAGYWRRHLREPVRFADALRTIYAEGRRVFLEIGPYPTLLNMGRHVVPEHECTWLPSLRSGHDDWDQMLGAVAELFVRGVPLDWDAFDRPYGRRKVALPTYPFQRERYWADGHGRTRSRAAAGGHPLLGRRLLSPTLSDIVFESELGATWPSFLDHHRIYGTALLPSPAYLEMALAAAAEAFGDVAFVIEDFVIREGLILPETDERLVQLVLRPDENDAHFEVFSRDRAEATWTLHATGRLVAEPAVPTVPVAFTAADAQSRCPTHFDGAVYYEQLADLGLEFGTGFRGVTDVWRRDGEALGRIVLPSMLADESKNYGMHPAMLDACFHVLGAAMPADEERNAYLLIGIDHFRLHRRPGAGVWNHTVLRAGHEDGRGTFAGDIRVYDDEGALVAEVLGLHLRYASRDALLRTTRKHADDWLYDVQWQPKARVAPSAGATSDSADLAADWLVLVDRESRQHGDALVEVVERRGERARLFAPTHGSVSRELMRAIGESSASRHRVVCLCALDVEASDLRDASLPDDIGPSLERTLDVTKVLIAARAPASLWIVTRGAQPAGGVTPAPAPASQWGLGRVIALEHPELWGGLLDLAPGSPSTVDAIEIMNEIIESDGEDQIAVRESGRFVARLARSSRPAVSPLPWRHDASYLITGGLGGLGLKLAHWMAERGARSVVLLGRNGLPPRERWDALAPASREAAQIAAVRAIEASGAVVEVVAADVADPVAMRALFDRFGADLPPLRGVIHAAAALSNWTIADMPADALRAMLHPKVDGTRILHELTRELTLDFFVLFSSTAALWGSRELGHYAAANHFLDAFACARQALGLPALSINWGTWDEMRVASAEDRQNVASTGLHPMSSDRALDVLGDLLSDPDTPQIVVASVDWNLLKSLYEARRSRPFLALVASRQPARAARRADAPPELTHRLASAPPQQHRALVVDFLRDEVARSLGIQPSTAVDVEQGLFEMGMDSLMAVELKTRIEEAVGTNLPSTLTFNYPNIEALTDYLTANVLAAVELVAVEPVGRGEPQTPDPVVAGTTQDDDLTEDDLADLLAARLAGLQ